MTSACPCESSTVDTLDPTSDLARLNVPYSSLKKCVRNPRSVVWSPQVQRARLR